MGFRAYTFNKNNIKRNKSNKWQRAGVLVAAFVAMGSFVTPVAFAAPGDFSWAQVIDSTVPLGQWNDVAMSRDGTKLAAVNFNGYIYTSSDSGVSWTERTSAGID